MKKISYFLILIGLNMVWRDKRRRSSCQDVYPKASKLNPKSKVRGTSYYSLLDKRRAGVNDNLKA